LFGYRTGVLESEVIKPLVTGGGSCSLIRVRVVHSGACDVTTSTPSLSTWRMTKVRMTRVTMRRRPIPQHRGRLKVVSD
jgi:hypothetical protein